MAMVMEIQYTVSQRNSEKNKKPSCPKEKIYPKIEALH